MGGTVGGAAHQRQQPQTAALDASESKPALVATIKRCGQLMSLLMAFGDDPTVAPLLVELQAKEKLGAAQSLSDLRPVATQLTCDTLDEAKSGKARLIEEEGHLKVTHPSQDHGNLRGGCPPAQMCRGHDDGGGLHHGGAGGGRGRA